MTVEQLVGVWACLAAGWLMVGGIATVLVAAGSDNRREVVGVARWTIAAPLWPIAALLAVLWCLWKLVVIAFERESGA